VTKVTVYSNLPTVELFANGVSLGVKEAADHFFYFDVPNVGETHLVAVAGELRDESMIRKVDVFNEDYRLKEKSAVLNWFDITMPEGYLSLNSKFSDIMGTLKGKLLVMGLFAKLMPQAKGAAGAGMDGNTMSGMMDMLGSFTFIRLAGMIGTMGIKFTKEELLDINAKLNKIKAPKQ
jgi:beta-galactosidase